MKLISIALAAALIPQTTDASACLLSASAGDAAAGISIITDISCKIGGLGCITNSCRYCAATKTLLSKHLLSCSVFGTTQAPPFSTTTPTPVPTLSAMSACLISERDKVVGIQAVSDTTCLKGGVGCSSSQCRQCKYFESPHSTHLLSCTSLGYTFLTPPSTTIAELPASACTNSADDLTVGIKAVMDSNCRTGGLGCYNTRCRYCKATATPQSAHLLSCSTLTSEPTYSSFSNAIAKGAQESVAKCTQQASQGDADVGVLITTDSSCVNGGIGCIDAICRFCKAFESSQSASFLECSDLDGTTSNTFPTMSTPTSAPTSTPSPTTSNTEALCTQRASIGDTNAGVLITTDPSCATGGIGCINAICRFCKASESPQSMSFVECSAIGGTASDPASVSTKPIPAPTQTLSPPAVTLSSPSPSATPTPSPTTASSVFAIPLECDISVTSGDAAVGLSIVSDLTCGDGGTGCVDSICRFCKAGWSTKPSAYKLCSDIVQPDLSDIDFVPITLVDDNGAMSAPMPSKSAADMSASCSMTVSPGDAAIGIQIVTDPDCITSGGLGCIPPSACKYCKTWDTTMSMVYEFCDGYPVDSLETRVVANSAQTTASETHNDSFWVGLVLSAAIVTMGIACIAAGRTRVTISVSSSGGPTAIEVANLAEGKAACSEDIGETASELSDAN